MRKILFFMHKALASNQKSPKLEFAGLGKCAP